MNTDFLYPFLDNSPTSPIAPGRAVADLLTDLAANARAKAQTSAHLQQTTLTELGPKIRTAATAMATRFANGGRLYTFGNGGSSTDAATLAALFAHPPHGTPKSAWCLTDDQAVLTALGNDIGFDVVFSRQLIALARPGDMVAALSTSGNSPDLLLALAEAKKRGLLTLGFAGYDGGRMATSADVDQCFVVRSHSVHRIQESQAAVGYHLWKAVTDVD